MAAEFGLKGNEITVNSISIGPVYTDALQAAIDDHGRDFVPSLKNLTLIKRIALPEEIANIVAFIASPLSSNISGNQIPANGGALASLQG